MISRAYSRAHNPTTLTQKYSSRLQSGVSMRAQLHIKKIHFSACPQLRGSATALVRSGSVRTLSIAHFREMTKKNFLVPLAVTRHFSQRRHTATRHKVPDKVRRVCGLLFAHTHPFRLVGGLRAPLHQLGLSRCKPAVAGPPRVCAPLRARPGKTLPQLAH